jgi:hypothetical protein
MREFGACGLRRVVLRWNVSTIWSLSPDGWTLNIHAAFATAPRRLIRDLATIAADGGELTPRCQRAMARVEAWPPLEAHQRRLRWWRSRWSAAPDRALGAGPCCGTPAQRLYLRRLYEYLNATRFGGRLPRTIPLRFSNRMSSCLGHMVPGEVDGRRVVLEIALNVDLLLSGNGRVRLDTMLHEMAHALDYLRNGNLDHGPAWRRIAARVGCDPNPCTFGIVRRRRRGVYSVRRVPRLPPGVKALLAA